MNKLKVAVIIPAYNEGLVIKNVVSGVYKEFLDSKKYTVDVIVIDDGSKDNTYEAAKGAGAKVVKHIINSGAGAATSTGLSYARQNAYDVAATIDGDGQHLTSDLRKCIDVSISEGTDLLVGSRLIDSDGMSRTKVLGNRGLSFVTYLFFGVYVTDSQSGLRVFSKTAIDTLQWKSTGYEFCSEMLWRAKQADLSIKEAPIKALYTDYSKSKGQSNWNAFNIVSVLLKRRVKELTHE